MDRDRFRNVSNLDLFDPNQNRTRYRNIQSAAESVAGREGESGV